MIASHYVEAVPRAVARPATLHLAASEDAEALGQLTPGEQFAMLDDSLGWAWGYAGEDRRVGYVRSEALAPVM